MYVKVFVGFGGSGGKTLAHLARLIADDGELAESGRRFFSFFLIDTDRKELMEARKTVLAQFDRVGTGRPHVEIMDLSANVDRLQDLVHARFGPTIGRVRGESSLDPATNRDFEELREAETHWWFDADRVPFSGRRLPSAVARGAGQCPLAAHFVAWDKLPEMTKHLTNIKTEILRRQNENESVELYLVGSLAGGTGRGCWQLLSLKAREIFQRCTPTTYFFDASVFKEVEENYPDQRFRLHVNSLTGLSEVAGWLRNDSLGAGRGGQRRFFVPDLKGLATGRLAIDTDRIAHATREPQLTGRTPVQNCYVITRTSDSVGLGSEAEAYELAAAALYSRLASPGIEGAAANQIHTGTCCAGIARVSITEIRDCIRQLAVYEAVQGMTTIDADAVVKSVAVLTLPFSFSDQQIDRIRDHAGSDSLVGAFGKAMARASDSARLNELMNAQNLDEVLALAANGKYATTNRDAVAAALRAALLERMSVSGGVWTEEFRARIETQLGLHLSGLPALGVAAETIRRSMERLDELLAFVNPLDSFPVPDEARSRAEMVAELKSLARRDGLPLFGKRFEEDEVKTAESKMRSIWLQANEREAIVAITRVLNEARQILAEYDAVLSTCLRVIDRVRANALGEYERRKRMAFLPNDPTELLAQTPDWTSARGKLFRSLRPPLRESAFRDLVRGPNVLGSSGVTRSMGRITDQIRNSVLVRQERELYRSQEFQAAQSDKLNREIGLAIDNNLHIPAQVLTKEFGLLKVITDIEEHVRRMIEENLGQEMLVSALQDSFEALFGRRFLKATGAAGTGMAPIPAEDLLGELAYSLASKCDPMFEVDWNSLGEGGTPREMRDRAEVYVPCAGLEEDAIKSRLTRMKALSESIKTARICPERQFASHLVHQYSVNADPDGHYTVVAYTTFTLPDFDRSAWDPVLSFRYWQTDPEIARWLLYCEDAEGRSVWEGSNGNLGLGYVHPSFVRESAWQALRWRPWALGAAAASEANQRLDALLYALAGNVLDSGDDESQEAKRVRDAVTVVRPNLARDQGWTMPLLRRGSGGDLAWAFTRRAFVGDGFGTINAVGGSWNPGHSFATLQAFVRWLGDPSLRKLSTEGAEFINAIVAERRLVQKAVLSAISSDFGDARRIKLSQALAAFLHDYKSRYLAGRPEEQRKLEGPLVDALIARVSSGHWTWERDS